MVQFISLPESTRSRESRDAATSAGNALGQYFGYGAKRSNIESELQGVKQALSQPGIQPADIYTQLAKTSAILGPGSDRFLSALVPHLMDKANAEADAKAVSGEGAQSTGMQRDNSRLQPPQRQQLPGFMQNGPGIQQGQTSQEMTESQMPQWYPRQQPFNQAPGNAPQEATSGLVEPKRTPQQIIDEADRRAKASLTSPRPRTRAEIMPEVVAEEQLKDIHAKDVNAETERRAATQQAYGDQGEKALEAVYPEAKQEERNIFRKKSEDLHAKGTSENEIQRSLDQDARDLKNTIKNVEESLSAERSYNRIYRLFSGEQKSFDVARNDLRTKVKPLLDMGLVDKARTLLTDRGYYPEEVESVVSDLSPEVKGLFKGFKSPANSNLLYLAKPELKEQESKKLQDSLDYALKLDPNANLVLLRKELENRNVDWRSFANGINSIVEKGEWNPSPEQKNQLKYILEPPLTTLGKILKGLDLRGR